MSHNVDIYININWLGTKTKQITLWELKHLIVLTSDWNHNILTNAYKIC